VKKELKITKLETFYDYLRKGEIKDIINFMREKNLKNSKIFRFTDIYWLI
jgi:hypothetical protein